MKRIKKYFEDWTNYEKIWLVLFTILILVLSFYWEDNLIGIIASLTGIWTVILVAKGRISNYYFGIVNVIFYAYVAYNWNYYGEVMLNLLYFLPMQFVGLYLWRKNKVSKTQNDRVIVKIMTNNSRIIWIFISLISIIVYGFFLKYLRGNLPFIDSISTVLSVIAMILMAWVYIEQWVLWIIVDIVSIVMWFAVLMEGGNDIAVLLMWVAYLINAMYGLFNWIKLYQNQNG